MIIKRGNSYCKRCGELKLTEHDTINRYATYCMPCQRKVHADARRHVPADRFSFRGRTNSLLFRIVSGTNEPNQ